MNEPSAASTGTGQGAIPDSSVVSGMLSACAAAAVLGVNERTVRRAIARGELAAIKYGRSFRITPEALAHYRDRHHRRSRPDAGGTASAGSGVSHALASAPLLLHLVDRSGSPAFDLPRPLTPFLGREQEIAEIVAQMSRPEVRLLTLTGPGGVGKTRLAIRMAEKLAPRFADGVAYVSLASVIDTARVLPSIAQALGVRRGGDRPVGERLVAALRDQQLLLVLDNFEHLLPAAVLVTDLLATCKGLTILTTSRAVLRLSGEHIFPVPPLSLPDPAGGATAAEASRAEAVQLFVVQARAAAPSFELTDENAGAVSEVCQRVDGLPLAIELAAARVPVLPPRVLLTRLERRLPLLTGGSRDVPDRLRTMQSAIAWSYDLLTPAEQALLRRLSVFVGGFTIEAAESMTGDAVQLQPRTPTTAPQPEAAAAPPTSTPTMLDGLMALVDQSLVRRVDAPTGDAEPRFAMLETIREYGLERLATGGEEATARDAHAAYYLSYVERIEADLYGGRGLVRLLDALEVEHPNLRAALTHLGETAETEASLRLAGALAPFWLFHSHRGEGRGWLKLALDRARGAAAAAPRAKAVGGAAILAFSQGDYGRAAELAEESLTLRQDQGDNWGIATALNLLGAVERGRGDYDLAALRFEAALALFEETGDTGWIALARGNLGILAFWRGDLEQATALLEDAVALYRQAGDLYAYGAAATLSDLALVSCDRGDHTRAAALFAESLTRWREVGTKEGLADWLARVAVLAAERGQFAQAVRVFGAAESLCEAIGYAFELPARARH